MSTKLEVGTILETDERLHVNCGIVTMVYHGLEVPIGAISEDDYTWFKQTDIPRYTSVVYLGNFQFGIKQLTNAFDEFNQLDESIQKDLFMEMYQKCNPDKRFDRE